MPNARWGRVCPTARDCRDRDAGDAESGRGVETDPLTDGGSIHVDGEIGVHEHVAGEVELRAHPVAEVRRGHDALQRRRLLARDDRHGETDPHRGGPESVERAGHVPQLRSGTVKGAVVADGRRRAVPHAGAGRRVWVDTGDGTGHVRSGFVEVRRLQPDAKGPPPRHVALAARDAGVDELDLPSRARHRHRDGKWRQRDGAQEFDGEPGDVHGLIGRDRFNGARQQGGDRPAVQRVGRPRSPGEFRRDHGGPVGLEQSVVAVHRPSRSRWS